MPIHPMAPCCIPWDQKALSEVCKAINDIAYSVEVKSLERRDLRFGLPMLGGTDARH